MPITNPSNQVLPMSPTQYFVSDGTCVDVHPAILTSTSPAATQRALLTTAGTLAAGTTALVATTPITSKLFDQQRIVLPNNQVIAIDASAEPIDPATGARFFPVGATALKIYPSLAPLTMVATTPYEEFQPFWSCDTAKFMSEGKIVDFKNFRAGAHKTKKKTSLDTNFDTDGFVTATDPILQMLRRAANLADAYVKIRFIPPDGQGMEFTGQVVSDSRDTKDGDPYRCPFKFAIGEPTYFNFNLA